MTDSFDPHLSRRALASRIARILAIASSGRIASSQDSPAHFKGHSPNMTTSHLTIGCLIYPRQDQNDFTGPFAVLSRIPDSTVHVIAKTKSPVRDLKGLILTPEMSIAEAPQLDLLLVPGGSGQEVMDGEEILSFIRKQADSGRYVCSICTGALLCGAAGILRGRRATTYWAAWDLLRYYGAIPTKSRVVVDGNFISTGGVTAGLDGALTIAAILRGDQIAQEIQLGIEYAPNPPFHSGTPVTAPPKVVSAFYANYRKAKESREIEGRRFAGKLGITVAP
jgi:cyclohexyl-isocyanide hydratase